MSKLQSIAKTPRWLSVLLLTGLGLTCAFTVGASAARKRAAEGGSRLAAAFARLPLGFEPNRGQAAAPARFVSRGKGFGLALSPTGAVLSLSRSGARLKARDLRQPRTASASAPAVKTARVSMEIVGGNPNAELRGTDRLPGVSNYFLGNDPSRWLQSVPHFAKVRYSSVYPGVDLVYYGRDRQLEYDFLVSPGKDAGKIRLRFGGTESVSVNRSGELVLAGRDGTVVQRRPEVYQQTASGRVEVPGSYVQLAANEVGFQVGSYDRSRTLVIDPVLVFSTFLGGTQDDVTTEIALDTTGNAVVTGLTASTDFPLAGGVQAANAGGSDAFVSKISNDGQMLLWSTYLGGSGNENQYPDDTAPVPANAPPIISGGVAVNAQNQVYVAGCTRSVDFPTVQPIQVDNAGAEDAFVTKLNADGGAILWSTYLGGRGLDAAQGIAVDSSDNAYVVGETNSTDLNLSNPIQNSFRGGIRDGFFAKINAAGAGLVNSTYLGGAGEDRALAVAVDGQAAAYVTGITLSVDDPGTPTNEGFPITPGVFQGVNQGSSDGFVTKIDAGGAALDYSSYLGGSGENAGTGIAVDAGGSAYVCGFTTATDFPVSAKAFDKKYGTGESDGFVVKVSPDGSNLTYSTYLGGNGKDVAVQIAVSPAGSSQKLAYVTGYTTSTDFPTVAALRTSAYNPFDANPDNRLDCFITKFNVDGSAVEYSTYIGGQQLDRGTGIAVDPTGSALILGTTASASFPTQRAIDNTLNDGAAAGTDGFLLKLSSPPAAPGPLTGSAVNNSTIHLAWSINSDNETGFDLERQDPGGSFVSIAQPGAQTTTFDDTGLTANTTYKYRIRATNSFGGSPYSNVVSVSTFPDPPAPAGTLVAKALTQTSVKLTWKDNSNSETGFKILRSTDNLTFVQIATSPANTTAFTNSGLTADTTYFYQVVATNQGGDAAPSNTASVTTLKNKPSAPSNLRATTASASIIDLAWVDNSGNEDGFKVFRSTDNVTFGLIATTAADANSFRDTGLNANTTYFYKVAATNNGGDSATSNVASAKTLPAAPSAPANLAVTTLSQTSLKITWQNTAANQTGFKLERSNDGGVNFNQIATPAANATTFTDNGLAPDTTYFYRIRSTNNGGDSAFSNTASGTTLPNPPAAPSDLTATATDQTDVDLNFTDNSDNEGGFQLERSTDNGISFKLLATLAADTTTFTDSTLKANSKYVYRVRAFNTGGNSSYSNLARVTTPPNSPAAPSNLQITVAGPTSLRLVWTDNAVDEAGFVIERSDDDGVTFSQVAAVAADVTTYVDPGLAPDTTYFYRVRATNQGGDSANSNAASGTTPPAPPSSLTATTVDNTSIRLFWSDDSTTETGFQVQRKSGNLAFSQVALVPAGSTTYLDQNLTGGTTYTYRVRAVRNSDVSDYSNEASASTLPNAPSAPVNLKAANVTQTTVDLSWTDTSSNETQFEVERSTDQGQNFTLIASVGANQTTFSDNGLSSSTEYRYRVRATNGGGASGYSNIVIINTVPSAPGAPSNLQATALSSTAIQLTWTRNSSTESGFKVQRRATQGGSFTTVTTTPAGSSSFQDSGLAANTSYTYRVAATNAGGDSAFSAEASAVTLPTAPTGLTAQPSGSDRITLSWTHSGAAQGFHIQRKSAGQDFSDLQTVDVNSRSFTDSGLLPASSFTYRVLAFNQSGNSAPSNEASASTGAGIADLTLSPSTIKGGAKKKVTGTVTLTGPAPAGGINVSLSSNITTVISSMPSSVSIPAGASSATFKIKTKKVRRNTTVTIRAAAQGISRSAPLLIKK